MGQLLLLLWLLNLFDAVATAQWVTGGYAYEVNPLMAWWLSVSVWVFLVGKVALVSIGVAGISLLGAKTNTRFQARVVAYAIGGLVGVYGLLALWHVVFAVVWVFKE